MSQRSAAGHARSLRRVLRAGAVVVVVALAGAAAVPAFAQTAASEQDTGPTGTVQRLASDLGLDAGQQERIRPVLMAHRDELQRLKRDAHLAPAERQRRILALGDRTADQIRAQLNDDQRARYIQPRAAAATPRPNAGKDVKR